MKFSKKNDIFAQKKIKNILNSKDIVAFAKGVVRTERDAVATLEGYIDEEFVNIASLIFNSSGRLIITGIGKSAIIAQKIVATLNSTGTPAIFLHAADAIHGDLGIVQNGDVVICISKSGNSPEIEVLVPLIKRMGNVVVGMVGNLDSTLSKAADYILNTTVFNEACPNNLAPTSSTTAQLVMGDALSMTLLKMRGFTAEDFSRFHPGGALGKRLYTRVGDLLSKVQPMVTPDESISNVIVEISSGRLGATAVVENNTVVGMITDGDLRRMLQNNKDLNAISARDIMTANPKTIEIDELASKAHNIMEECKITNLIVLMEAQYCGIIHLHDIIRGGIV